MKKNLFGGLMMLLTMGITLSACSSDDGPVIINEPVSVSIEMPLNLENVVVSNDVTTLVDVKTGETYVSTNAIKKTADGFVVEFNDVAEGTYNLTSQGELTFTVDGVAGKSSFETTQENVVLSRQAKNAKLTVNTFAAKGGFVISES